MKSFLLKGSVLFYAIVLTSCGFKCMCLLSSAEYVLDTYPALTTKQNRGLVCSKNDKSRAKDASLDHCQPWRGGGGPEDAHPELLLLTSL